MKLEVGKTYRTRGGQEVRIYATDGNGNYPVHGAIQTQSPPDHWISETWMKNGNCCITGPSPRDIVPPDPVRAAAIDECIAKVHGMYLGVAPADDPEPASEVLQRVKAALAELKNG